MEFPFKETIELGAFEPVTLRILHSLVCEVVATCDELRNSLRWKKWLGTAFFSQNLSSFQYCWLMYSRSFYFWVYWLPSFTQDDSSSLMESLYIRARAEMLLYLLFSVLLQHHIWGALLAQLQMCFTAYEKS